MTTSTHTPTRTDDEATKWRVLRRLAQASQVVRTVFAAWGWWSD